MVKFFFCKNVPYSGALRDLVPCAHGTKSRNASHMTKHLASTGHQEDVLEQLNYCVSKCAQKKDVKHNKKFWKTVEPLFPVKEILSEKKFGSRFF